MVAFFFFFSNIDAVEWEDEKFESLLIFKMETMQNL